MESIPYLSIVSPVYKAEFIVDELVQRVKNEVSQITENFEIILIEDGSPDNSWSVIEKNCKNDKRIKGIKLSRNFGQHYAIAAGLNESNGDYVVVMDSDLQDNPKYIIDLLNKAKEGFEIVFTVKNFREHNNLRNLSAFWFNKVFNKLIGNKNLHSHGKIGAYSLITRKVVDSYRKINDYYRPYLTVLQWLGYSNTYLMVMHDKRYQGKSSYSVFKLISHATNGIISQTSKLLRLSIYLGFFFALISIIFIVYIVIKSIESGFQPGWASIATLVIFFASLILINLGIIGIYIGKLFEQTKSRPLYLIEKKINF
jgi:dolichol-phosphate mannosyltransferase